MKFSTFKEILMKKLILYVFLSIATHGFAQEYKPVKLFSLLHMSRAKVEVWLGEPQQAVFEHFQRNKTAKIAAFQYITTKGEYHISYENELCKAIAFYPNSMTKQEFGENKLFEGGIYDIDNFDSFFSKCAGLQGEATLDNQTYYMITHQCSNNIERSIIFFGEPKENVYRVLAYY